MRHKGDKPLKSINIIRLDIWDSIHFRGIIMGFLNEKNSRRYGSTIDHGDFRA